MSKDKQLTIRSSTAEFLIFEKQAHGDGIEVRYEDETLWLTQKMMAQLFDVSVKTVNEHLRNVYVSGELEREATVRKFRIVQTEGTRQIARNIDHYNLDAVISVGYRVNSIRATQFRRWATQVLAQYAIIYKAFVKYSEEIKREHQLTLAYESILETLAELDYEDAAVILDEFRLH